MISYLLDVSLCWLIFYLLYYFWLSKETFFHLNRWYLLSTLLLGLLIPVLPSPFMSSGEESEWVTLYVAPITMGLESLQVTVTAPAEMERHFDWTALLWWAYWAGVVVGGIRFLSGLWRIGTLYWNAEHIRVGDFKVALTQEAHLPFSFFDVIFKSKQGNLDAFAEEKITEHELAHVRGWHTFDVLLVELVSILLWCSPPVYLYRRSLRIVHEYIADSAAIRSGEKKQYGHLLIRQSQSGLELALANHFIQSQLKKRITMMTKTRSSRQAVLKYLPVIPLLVVALVIFSNWKAVASDPLDLVNGDPLSERIEVLPASPLYPAGVHSIQDEKALAAFIQHNYTEVASGPVGAANAVDAAHTTASKVVPEDYDPKVLRKQLSAILHKRQNLTENQDSQLALNFAALHDEWVKKYPDHQQEIRLIAEEVAGEYELELSFSDKAIAGAYFRQPFQPATGADIIRGYSESGVRIELSGTDKDPYVLLNDKPAPADWKVSVKPEDIQSIDVLKGETALKEYGTIAQHGAIRIYTKAFLKVETVLPRFPGCEDLAKSEDRDQCSQKMLMEYLFSNIKYPETYSKYNVQGTVVASYTVDKSGKVKDIRILRSIGAGFDKEVQRVLNDMPLQIPGTINGQVADIEMKLPIKFKATKEEVLENPDLPAAQVIISKLGTDKGHPLYFVDGKIISKMELETIAPGDIERIDVLKGDKAIAEYGDAGADGAVKIFTKTRAYDQAPLFQGCEETLATAQLTCSQHRFLETIYKNIRYPATAREQRIQGTVIVKYTIGADGKIQNLQIIKGIGGGCDEEVLRVIREVPDWKPAMKDGNPVALELILPVQYRLEGETSAKPMPSEEEALKKATATYRSAMNNDDDQVVVVGYGKVTARTEVFKVVEEIPRFPGCEEVEPESARDLCAQRNMLDFVYRNITYPKAAKEAGVEGIVVASFIVSKTGKVEDVRIERGLGYGLNEQVVEAITKMPIWIPGKQNGKAVAVEFTLPVRFGLDNEANAVKKPTTVHVNGPETSTPAAGKLELRSFKAAPNPSNGQINLRFQADARPVSVRIMSPNGQAVYQRELPQFDGNFDEQIDLREAPKGTLYIMVQQGDKVYNSTIVVQ